MAVGKTCDAFIVYLFGLENTLRPDPAPPSAIFNSRLSSISRVANWLLALQPFRFTVNHIKGNSIVAVDTFSRIPWPVAMPKACEIIQVEGELDVDIVVEEESESQSQEKGEESFQQQISDRENSYYS